MVCTVMVLIFSYRKCNLQVLSVSVILMKLYAAYNASSQSETQLYISGIVPFCSAYIHYFVWMNGLAFAVY